MDYGYAPIRDYTPKSVDEFTAQKVDNENKKLMGNAQKLKNVELAIDLGLRELGFTNADNWNEFIDRQVQRGIFDAKYGQSLKAAGYSDLAVEDLRQKGMDIYKRIQYQMEGRRLDQADRRLDQGDTELRIKQDALDFRKSRRGGGGGSLDLSMGSGYTDERPSGAGVFAPQSVPSRRSVPTAPSGCSGGTCPLPPVSNLSGGSLSNAMAALPSAGESRSTLNDIFAALKQGYQSTTAQPANTLGMYAAAPSPTMTDAAPAQSPAAPYYEGFYNNPAVTGKGWNFKYSDKMSPRNLNKSAKGVPDIDQFNPVTNEARETMNKALWPSQYVKEGSGYSGKDLVSPEYMPEAKDIFEQFALRGINPNEAAKKTRDFLLSAAQGPKGTKAAGKDAPEGSYDYNSPDWMTTRANDLYIQAAQRRRPISYADAVATIKAQDAAKQEEAMAKKEESTLGSRAKKFVKGLTGGGTDEGMIQPGNIDLSKRKVLQNQDGSVSTISSMSVGFDGKQYLIPTVVDGKRLSEKDAIEEFKRTGQHLGVFDSPDAATQYAKKISKQQEGRYLPGKPKKANEGKTYIAVPDGKGGYVYREE